MSKTVKLYTYVNGETADGAQVNADLANLVNAHNLLDDEVDERINAAVINAGAEIIDEVGSVFPSTPTEGQRFFHTTYKQNYIYHSGEWITGQDVLLSLIWTGV